MGQLARPTLQPKQVELFRAICTARASWIGFGGSRGAAKSGGIRRIALILALRNPGIRALIFRRTFPELWGNHIEKFFQEWPVLRKLYNTQTKQFTFENGSTIKFGHAEHEGDIKDFQGQEYHYIFPDEATHLSQAELEFLKTCNRAPDWAAYKCKMVLTMNPGGIGHKFIKRIFFDRQYVNNERPEDYLFIQAYGWDNVEWVRAPLREAGLTPTDFYGWDEQKRFQWFIEKSDYGRVLNSLPESMRIGHLLGRWDVFAGQYFDCFNYAQHCFRPEKLKIEPRFSRWIAIDWGFAHPASCHWFVQGGPKTFIIRELMLRGVGPKELAAAIVQKNGDGKPEAIYLSPDAFAKRTDADTIAQQMDEIFAEAGWPPCSPADNDRVGGWALIYEMLKRGELEISTLCPNLIETIPALARDEKKPEDCVKFNAGEGKFDGDDAADSARYGLKSRVASHSKSSETQIEEIIQTQKDSGLLRDPTSEMIRRAMLTAKLRQQGAPIPFAYRRRRHGSSPAGIER